MGTELCGGHTESILCASVTLNGILLTGGEGGEFCIWSQDTLTPNKIKISETDDVTSVCCSKRHDHEIYLACGSNILAYDLRSFSAPLYTLTNNEDEINQVALHEKEDFLAACDDSGQVKVYNLRERRVFKTLRKHTNICYSISFRPGRNWDLLSGGLDSMLMQWDFSRGRSVCTINMQDFEGCHADAPESHILSPPFIYSIDVSKDGKYTVCGMENALVTVFDSSKRTLAYHTSLRGHTSGVSQVHFLSFADHLFMSGGNDGRLQIWDTNELAPEQQHTNGASNGISNGGDHGVRRNTQIHPKYSIEHGEKINWMTSMSTNTKKAVLIADNSSKLTMYDVAELS